MKTTHFNKQKTAESMNETLQKKFGKKIDLQNFTFEQLERANSLIETKLSEIKKSRFNETLTNEEFHRLKMMHDVVKTALEERAVSKAQQKFMGMVHAAKKGEKPASKKVAKAEKSMTKKEAEKFASTKHAGLPEKKKKTESVSEEKLPKLTEGFSVGMKVNVTNPKATPRHVITKIEGDKVTVKTPDGKENTFPLSRIKKANPSMNEAKSSTNDGNLANNAKPYDKVTKADVIAGRLGKDEMGGKRKVKNEKIEERSTGDYSAKKARAGKDIGKPGKEFGKIAKSAEKQYGSKERGEKVAGAVLKKLRAKESMSEAINRLVTLTEGEEAKAEIIMSVRNMVDRFTAWSEDIAKMQAQTAMELADEIRDQMGQETAEMFIQAAQPALDSALEGVKSARESLNNTITVLTGESSMPMGAEPEADATASEQPAEELPLEPTDQEGGEEKIDIDLDELPPEPEGRAKRESIEQRIRITRMLVGS